MALKGRTSRARLSVHRQACGIGKEVAMTHLLGRCVVALGLLLVVALPGAWAQAQSESNIFLDFDDDGDPWTIRTALPQGVTSGAVKFILEVNELPLPPFLLDGTITEGCCNGPYYDGHYGTQVDAGTVTFNPVYVGDFGLAFPTCTYCCPWILTLLFDPSAPVAVGQRYFIGEAQWNAYCDISDPCSPPTEFTAFFNGIGGVSQMVFSCPPTASDPFSWGRIRSLYR
jgi:hypothetical protein